jgi:hypothetical protein
MNAGRGSIRVPGLTSGSTKMRSRNSEQGHPKARLKGYIYIIETGVDPALYSDLADPTFGRPPTLGPRVPTVSVPRRLDIHRKRQGSRISTIRSRRAPGKRKGPRLGSLCAPAAKKVSARQGRQGERRYHCPGRRHARIFIIGSHAITLATPKEVEFGRPETFSILPRVPHRPTAERVIDVMSRMLKLEERQVQNMLKWLGDLKARAARS